MTVITLMGLNVNFPEFFYLDIRKSNWMLYSNCTKFQDSCPKYLPDSLLKEILKSDRKDHCQIWTITKRKLPESYARQLIKSAPQ